MTNSKVYVAPYEQYPLAVQGASKATAKTTATATAKYAQTHSFAIATIL